MTLDNWFAIFMLWSWKFFVVVMGIMMLFQLVLLIGRRAPLKEISFRLSAPVFSILMLSLFYWFVMFLFNHHWL